MKKEILTQKKIDGYLRLCKMINYYRKNPIKCVEQLFGMELLDYQKYIFMESWSKSFSVWCMSRASGKALSLDTPIQTPDGIKLMCDIQVGDYVIGKDGNRTKVTYVSDIFLNHDCYELEFEDGEKIIADADHLWQTNILNLGDMVVNTKDLYEKYKNDISEYKVCIPNNHKVNYEEKDLKTNPYLFGVGLNDTRRSKYIPNQYLYSSIKQRENILKGLLSVHKPKYDSYKITDANRNFILQIGILLSSLGIKNYMYNIGNYYEIGFLLNEKYNKYKAIINIKKIESVPTKCIAVDNDDSLFLCGNKFTVTHNTTLAAPFIMAKSLLIPSFKTYIISGVGSQAQESFMKIEDITKRNLASFTGLTDVFANELVKSTANKDGFTHDPVSFKFSLYNGSKVFSLNSNPDNLRSKRANLVFYDEAGFVAREVFTTSEPYVAQDSEFSLGKGHDITVRPRQIPNQLIYASSASSTDTYFWEKYKSFSKKMLLGNRDYFVADVNADVVMNATYNGKKYEASLLKQAVIDNAINENKEKGLREYFNIFTTEGGAGQIVSRGTIIRNSTPLEPILENNSNKKFLIAYDPARSYDNCVALVSEIIQDKNVGYKLIIRNCINFVDVAKKKKTPIRTPEQMVLLKQHIINYNGKRCADYENIEKVLIDAGSGGGGVNIADYLMEDWEMDKIKHRGLIDKIESADYVKKFPNAVDKIKLINPNKYRNDLFEALKEMVNLDLVVFPEEYNGKGYILLKENEKDIEGTMRNLSEDEELSLNNIDLLKEELINIYETKSSTSSKANFGLPKDKEKKMHDDRVFTLAMSCWYLQQLRRNDIVNKEVPKVDIGKMLMSRKPIVKR